MNRFTKAMLLGELDRERGKFTVSDEKVMQDIIDDLVKEGIYPSEPTKAMKKYGYTILNMVQSWGVNWYLYDEPLECPYCKVNLRDEENGTPFKREIAMNDYFLDGVIDCICPDCYCSLNNGKRYDKNAFERANNSAPLDPLEN